MTLQRGSVGRRARLKGLAQSIRRFLGSVDDDVVSFYKVMENVDVSHTTLYGDDSVIDLHEELVGAEWFVQTTIEGDGPERLFDSDNKQVLAIKLTEDGKKENAGDEYIKANNNTNQAVVTDGGEPQW